MFRIVSILIIILSIIWLFFFLKKNKISITHAINSYFSSLKNSFTEIKSKRNNSSLKNFVYVITVLLFLLMFLSAFLNVLFWGNNLTGLLLLIHVSIAPFFSLFLALTIILFAQENSFNKNDFNKVMDQNNNSKNKLNLKGYSKIVFWLITFFAIPIMVSIILSMFPLFGTEGQIILLNIHRYSTLIILILFIFHIGLVSVDLREEIIQE